LLARRLVEADVRLVNVFWTFYGKDGCQFNLWDNHGSDKDVCGGANRGVDMLTHDYCCPSFDRAFSALLQDLNDRSLLDDTLVVVVGEFGRTPKINKNAGRDHWGSCYSAVLAGGGVRGGQVYGESDGQTASVVDSPVTPYDLHATVLHAFGVEPSQTIDDRAGRPIPVTDGQPVKALF
jgi:arylsulfatase A-like enzyme